MSDRSKIQELHGEVSRMTPKSGAAFRRAKQFLPRGLTSFARAFEPHPFYSDRAKGSRIWDIDGNEYLDCCMSFGVLLLGHRHPATVRAVEDQLQKGWVYGSPHELEIEFAEKLTKCIPCGELVQFCNSGTEATMQAMRIARAYSGKDVIAKFEGGFHGWHDYALWNVNLDPERAGASGEPGKAPESAGIPTAIRETVLILPYDERAFSMIDEHAGDLAAVIVEPVIGGWTLPMESTYLERLREVTRRTGVMLIFDEVITGFRLALGGAQELYGVTPDIATYGKTIGGGLPIGAVAASRSIFEAVTASTPHVWVAGTFSGNPVTLAAGNATLDYLISHPQIYDEMSAKGALLRDGFNGHALAKGLPGCMTGVGSLFQVHLRKPPIAGLNDLVDQDQARLQEFSLHLRLNGVFVPGIHLAFLSAAHSDEDVDTAIEAHCASLESCYDS